MWLIGRHYDHLAIFQVNRLAGNDDFCFAFNEIDQGVKWRRVLT
jgi:hypothetical protein